MDANYWHLANSQRWAHLHHGGANMCQDGGPAAQGVAGYSRPSGCPWRISIRFANFFENAKHQVASTLWDLNATRVGMLTLPEHLRQADCNQVVSPIVSW